MPSDLTAHTAASAADRLPAANWTERGSPAFRRASLALFLAGFSTFSLLYCVQPLLPVLAGTFRVGAAASSLALSLTSGLLAISIFLAGALSETVGRKSLMTVSLCSAAVFNVAAALAPTWPTLLIARALEGVALGGAPAVAMAYIAEEIHPDGLGYAMGLYVGGTAFGGMAGRVVTGIAADLGGWRVAMAVIGGLGLASTIGFALLLPPSRNFVRQKGATAAYHLKAWGGHLRHPGLPWVFATAFLVMGGFVTLYNYAGFRLTQAPYNLNQTQAGLIFLVYLFGMAASSSAGGLADKLGRPPVLICGLGLFAMGLGLTLLTPLPYVIAGIALVTIGFFMSHAVASGWVGRMAGSAKGHAASLYLLAYYLGASLMGSLGGWFWGQARWPGVAAFVAVLLACAMLVALRLSRFQRPLSS